MLEHVGTLMGMGFNLLKAIASKRAEQRLNAKAQVAQRL
jgi:hypothetical protein